MKVIQCTQLIRQGAVATASLTRMQTFIETGDRKLNDIQVRFDELPNIFNKFETAQNEIELSDTDHLVDRQQFEDQYFEVKAQFNELYILWSTHIHPPRTSLSGHRNKSPHSNSSSAHIKLPTIALPTFEGDTCSWLHVRDTFEALIVHNTVLSKVQKFHYLIASLYCFTQFRIFILYIFHASCHFVTKNFCTCRAIHSIAILHYNLV